MVVGRLEADHKRHELGRRAVVEEEDRQRRSFVELEQECKREGLQQ